MRPGARLRFAGWGAALALLALGVRAAEPDGTAVLRHEWADADTLRVTVRAVAPLEDAVLTWTAPAGVALVPVPADPTADEGRRTMALGPLRPGTTRALAFRIARTPPPAGSELGWIASVRLTARSGGRPVEEALGIPVRPPPEGRARFGAIEFPAGLEPRP
jgi:hypothetical protein